MDTRPPRCAQLLLCLYQSGDFTLLSHETQIALQEVHRFDAGKPSYLLRLQLGADIQFIGMTYGKQELQNVAIEMLICKENHQLVYLLRQAKILMEDIRA